MPHVVWHWHNLCLCSEDQCVSSPDVGDLSPEGPQPPLILLQQLLSASTQPSPIKAIFHRQELEVRETAYVLYKKPHLILSSIKYLHFVACVCFRQRLWLCVNTWQLNPHTRPLLCLRTAARAKPPLPSLCSTCAHQSRRNTRPHLCLLLPSSCSWWRWAFRGKTLSLPSNHCLEPQAPLVCQVMHHWIVEPNICMHNSSIQVWMNVCFGLRCRGIGGLVVGPSRCSHYRSVRCWHCVRWVLWRRSAGGAGGTRARLSRRMYNCFVYTADMICKMSCTLNCWLMVFLLYISLLESWLLRVRRLKRGPISRAMTIMLYMWGRTSR